MATKFAKTTEIIREIAEDGGPFVAHLDNGSVRVGYRAMSCVDSTHPAFRDLADRAAAIADDDEFEEAVAEALSAVRK